MTKTTLFTIAYSSESTIKPEELDQEISNIINTARGENAKRDITGVLLFMNNHFLHILEGPQDELYTLMEAIKKDKRHTNIEYLVEKPIQSRGFPLWAFNFYKLQDEKKIALGNLNKIRSGLSKNVLAKGQKILTFYNSLLK